MERLNVSSEHQSHSEWDNLKRKLRTKNGIAGIIIGLIVAATIFGICLWHFVLKKEELVPELVPLGLDFFPKPPENVNEKSLISYNSREKAEYTKYTNKLDELLTPYLQPTPQRAAALYNCDYSRPPPKTGVCVVDMKVFGSCTKENYYSYHRASPCVFIALNQKVGWIPEYYNDTSKLPDSMPKDLREFIESLSKVQLNTLWVSCEGETSADRENIGSIKYQPIPGFPGYYFPSSDPDSYFNPLVALWFERPRIGVLINIKCKAWARNLNYEKGEGIVHFELLID